MTDLSARILTLLAAHSAQAAVVAALVFACTAAFRGARARARCAAWLMALAAFVLPPVLTAELASRAGIRVPWLSRVTIRPEPVLPVPQPAQAQGLSATHGAAPFPLDKAAVLIWLAGAGVSIVLWVRRSRRLRALLRSGTPAVRGREAEAAERARALLRVRRRVRLLSADAPEPGTCGVLRPVVVMPRALADRLSDGELEAVLLHEVAHVKRRDAMAGIFQRLVRAVFWFHPAAWLVERKLIEAREHACDEEVVSRTQAADVYVSGLLNVCRYRIGAAPGLAGMAGPNLKRRLEAIMQNRNPANRWADRALTVAAVCAGLAVWLASGVASAGPQTAKTREDQLRALLARPFARWVQEDVAYIITPAERAEFLSLTSDAARQAFIERFWRLRDPDPSTPANEAKEEHYRRIAYANERFLDEPKPGWRTDRGRFYIIYGPPDEIETDPSRNEVRWMYRRFGGGNVDMIFHFYPETVAARPR